MCQPGRAQESSTLSGPSQVSCVKRQVQSTPPSFHPRGGRFSLYSYPFCSYGCLHLISSARRRLTMGRHCIPSHSSLAAARSRAYRPSRYAPLMMSMPAASIH